MLSCVTLQEFSSGLLSEYYSMYLSSNRSFIVASIDVRGSAVMGVEALHAVNEALGTVEITDTLDAIR